MYQSIRLKNSTRLISPQIERVAFLQSFALFCNSARFFLLERSERQTHELESAAGRRQKAETHTKTMKTFHSLIAGLRSATSILARRIAFPLLFLTAGLVLVHPCAGQSGTWTVTGSLATARYGHTATLPPNDKVLVAGRPTAAPAFSQARNSTIRRAGPGRPPVALGHRARTAHGDVAARRQGARRRRRLRQHLQLSRERGTL